MQEIDKPKEISLITSMILQRRDRILSLLLDKEEINISIKLHIDKIEELTKQLLKLKE